MAGPLRVGGGEADLLGAVRMTRDDSLALDVHGKSRSSLLLDVPVEVPHDHPAPRT